MANAKHLAILRKGVDAWNEWRRQNPDIQADLSRGDLAMMNLTGANLRRANLCGADLRRADLKFADLVMANLIGADLTEADLSRAELNGANLSRASLSQTHLTGTNFRGANLTEADLYLTNLSEADLGRTNLSRADLTHTNLSEMDLAGVNLMEANLGCVDLGRTNLSGADLRRAILRAADLSGANLGNAHLCQAILDDADLRYSQLSRCDFTESTLTGVRLYGTAKDDWVIQYVKCGHVFWDSDGMIRSPKDRDFAPDEFEQLYRTLPTIEYIFQNGMTSLDPLIMDRVVRAIRAQNPEYDIKIDSISARGLAPSITFTVQQENQKKPALQMVVAGYECRLRRLEAEKDRLYALLALAIDKAGTKLLVAGPGAVVATDGSTISFDQHIEYITNLRDAVAAMPEDSPIFAKVVKKTALDLIGSVLKDAAKGQVKEAAKQLYDLGKEFGPVVLSSAAYAALKSMMPGG